MIAETNSWQPDPPQEPGFYQMRCMETGQRPEVVTVVLERGVMWARTEDFPFIELEVLHYNLCDVTWRHAIFQAP